MLTIETINRTSEKLAAMFTENTGKSLMDSGDAYGRNWQRNAGLTSADFHAQKSATWERNWGVTLNAYHYACDRLSYTKLAEVLTRLMYVWECGDRDKRDLYYSGQEDFLSDLGADNIKGFNTYNWDNLLSQTLQGYEFEFNGQNFMMLQVHGGCDVRGGYTLPVIFELRTPYFFGQVNEAGLECLECEIVGTTYDSIEWRYYGQNEPALFGHPNYWVLAPEGYDFLNGCPTCGGDLQASIEESVW